jgi:hypothetical protein
MGPNYEESESDIDGRTGMQNAKTDSNITSILLRFVDGARLPLPDNVEIQMQLLDGMRNEMRVPQPPPHVMKLDDVPFNNDRFRDRYTLLASAHGYLDSDGSVVVNQGGIVGLKVMMIQKEPRFSFVSWNDFKIQHSIASACISCGIDDLTAKRHYEQLQSTKPFALACLLNLTCAMASINLAGKTPLEYLKGIIWDDTMAQDRFFAFADAALVVAVRAAKDRGEFAEEPKPKFFHPDATCSFKQVQFDTANVQLTFHENTTEIIDGISCVKVEPDIDYFRNWVAHALLEVGPNKLMQHLTNPIVVYAMRSTTALDEDGPVFDPGYTVV